MWIIQWFSPGQVGPLSSFQGWDGGGEGYHRQGGSCSQSSCDLQSVKLVTLTDPTFLQALPAPGF